MTEKAEKAILIGVKAKGRDDDFYSSFHELEGLVKAAGGVVVTSVAQAQDHPHAATYIGRGKIEELQRLVQEEHPDLLVFDRELSPVQLRNLEESLEVRIIDRTMLILDIFAQRARSREGQLQVELATLEYRLPRLTGKGRQLSRLGGGIGTRGAGEQKLELDRRYIRRRIGDIKRQIKKIGATRELHRKRRQRAGIREVSLVGYTNAGKSSLFNALCRAGHSSGRDQAAADHRLFQTLDTTTRKIGHFNEEQFLLTDTVGFIQKLPHHLIQAFRSTLEEATRADLILHVIDVSEPDYLGKMATVEQVLDQLGADRSAVMPVFTKIDRLPEGENHGYTPGVSAVTGQGIDMLLEAINRRFEQLH